MWQDELKREQFTLNKNTVILYGNIDDLFEHKSGTDSELAEYLSNEVYADKDVVMTFNIGTGLKFKDEKSKDAWETLLAGFDALKGTSYSSQLPADSGEIFRLLNRFFYISGTSKNAAKRKSIALIITHTELLIPAQNLSDLSLADKKVLVTLQEWATDQRMLDQEISITLITDSLLNINSMLVADVDIAKVEVTYPETQTLQQTLEKYIKTFNVELDSPIEGMIKAVQGLNRKGVVELCKSHTKMKMDQKAVSLMKKEIIEKENDSLIEFVESTKTLDLIAGHEKVVERLREDSKLIQDGKLDAVPMGYLICGPVGTGKSYLAECFAGEVGIPVVKIKNFRDRWVGSTESNWEKIVMLLKNLAPVLVLVDEADAALGNREQEGDSGTSKRVFASLAQTMGDTNNRGKLIWMLLTARPELLPIDLKRQGRAEVHLPLLYPSTVEEKYQFFEKIGAKYGFTDIGPVVRTLSQEALQEIRSGADVESILVKLKRFEYLHNTKATPQDITSIIASYRASISPEDVIRQTQAALAEVTDKDLLEDS